jgi:hypothetical protein
MCEGFPQHFQERVNQISAKGTVKAISACCADHSGKRNSQAAL